MKTKYWMVLLTVFFYPHAAQAETISGRVTYIDLSGKTVTFKRGSGDLMTVRVKNDASLSGVKRGHLITLNAASVGSGWETSAIQTSADPSQSNPGRLDESVNSKLSGDQGEPSEFRGTTSTFDAGSANPTMDSTNGPTPITGSSAPSLREAMAPNPAETANPSDSRST